jgi:23S rRNA pseudouridine2605 synthase
VTGVPLARLLSKRRIASRSQAVDLIREGRVRVNGQVITNIEQRVVASAAILVDDEAQADVVARTIALNKLRGTITTRHDPDGRPTVFDTFEGDRHLVAVGRLDRASTGLLVLTTDTALAATLTDPANAIVRRYVVTVRGRVDEATVAGLEDGVDITDARGRVERLSAARVELRKASGRESHLVVDLDEGKNREIRRLFESAGHEVTRLHRVAFGAIELGTLGPGEWRDVSAAELRATLGRASEAIAPRRATTRSSDPPRARSGGSGSAASGASARGRSRSR